MIQTNINQGHKNQNDRYFEVDVNKINRHRKFNFMESYSFIIGGIIISLVLAPLAILADKKSVTESIQNYIFILIIIIPLFSYISIDMRKRALAVNRCATLSIGFFPPFKPYTPLLFRLMEGRIKNDFFLQKDNWFVKWSDIVEIINLEVPRKGPFYCDLKLKNGIQFHFSSIDLNRYYKRKDQDKELPIYEKLMRKAFMEINKLINEHGSVPEDYRLTPP